MSAARSLPPPADVWSEAQNETFRICSRTLYARARMVANDDVRNELTEMAKLFERQYEKGKR